MVLPLEESPLVRRSYFLFLSVSGKQVLRRAPAGAFLCMLALHMLLSWCPFFAETAVAAGAVSSFPLSAETESLSLTLPAAAPLLPDRFDSDYLAGFARDARTIILSPVAWKGKDWLTAGIIAGATTGLFFADAEINALAERNQNIAGKRIADAGNFLGDPVTVLPSLGLFYLYGEIFEDPKARRASLLAMESMAFSGLFTYGIKLSTQRSRPSTVEDPNVWNGFSLKDSNSSFPSMHTQTAFSVASVLAEEYREIPAVTVTAYGLATLTGLSRIYSNKHWVSDVFLGGAVGYFVGKAVVRYHTPSGSKALRIQPVVMGEGLGLKVDYHF